MILKFNNGRGALLCEQCRVIVMENLNDYEWNALRLMEEDAEEWFCKTCHPELQKEQALKFVEIINDRYKV